MESDSSGIRQRRTGITRIVEDLDIFEKVIDNVKEEKRVSSGFISFICFSIITCLTVGELWQFAFGAKEYDYRFDVDIAYDEKPTLDIDMIVATSCGNIMLVNSMDETGHIFAPRTAEQEHIKKDPTRFEFTEEEQLYWTVLRHAHARISEQGLRGLQELQYIDSDVEETLEHLADEKQKSEAEHIKQQNKGKHPQNQNGHFVLMMGGGVGIFQMVATSNEQEGTACRIHGKFQVRKGGEEKIVMSVGSPMALSPFGMGGDDKSGNTSHRIEKFSFGRRVHGLVAPLAGAEQISASGQDIYRYFIKVVPTKIYHGIFGGFTMTYQYSVTFLKKQPKPHERQHGGILFEYEFAATVIEIREVDTSFFTLILRLCAVVGGVFATSNLINTLTQLFLGACSKITGSSKRKVPDEYDNHSTNLLTSDIRVH